MLAVIPGRSPDALLANPSRRRVIQPDRSAEHQSFSPGKDPNGLQERS